MVLVSIWTKSDHHVKIIERKKVLRIKIVCIFLNIEFKKYSSLRCSS